MKAAAVLVARELRIERSGRESLSTVLPFVAVAVLMAGLAFGGQQRVLAAVAPGTVWLVVLFAAAPLARLAAAAERDEGTWDLLRGLVAPTALLAGKIGGLWVQFLATWAVAAGLAAVLLPAPVRWPALAAGPLGTLGVATLTVAFGTLLAGAGRRGGLLAVLLLPVTLPLLLAGTALGTPGIPSLPWLLLLVAYDVLVVAAVWAVHPALLEE
jgi:heme exporter protein B